MDFLNVNFGIVIVEISVGGVSFYTKPAKFFRIRGHLTYTLSPFVQV
jgi:hypothetical protein